MWVRVPPPVPTFKQGLFYMKATIGKYKYNDDFSQECEIIIEDHDHVSPYHTIARISLPLLQNFQKKTKSYPSLSIEEEIQKGETPDQTWDRLLSEMIYAMNHIANDEVAESEMISQRVDRGLLLFGKYFRDLWS